MIFNGVYLLANQIKRLHPAERDCGERMPETRERSCTCGGCGTDGFGTDAGSNSREVDNEISTGREP